MKKQINFYEHNLTKSGISFDKVLSSLYLTSGPISRNVEEIIKKKFKIKNCILTNSWTNGVIALLLAIKLKANDEIIVPAMTFVSCANVAEMVGAKVVFADIDPNTKLMDIQDVVKKITKKTRLIMPVHLYGNIFDTYELKRKIRKDIMILEDCAHCFDGTYRGKKIGHYSDFAVFSFYATKNITCGEGGAIILHSTKTSEKIRSICNNGMTKSALKRFEDSEYKHWDVNSYGLKANLSDINSNLLKKQILNYEQNLKKRKMLYDFYLKKISQISQISTPRKNIEGRRDYHLFPIGVSEKLRDKLIKYLNENKIQVTVNFRSILELNYYKKKYKKYKCLNSLLWGKQTLSLPFHLNLKKNEIIYVLNTLKAFFNKNI